MAGYQIRWVCLGVSVPKRTVGLEIMRRSKQGQINGIRGIGR